MTHTHAKDYTIMERDMISLRSLLRLFATNKKIWQLFKKSSFSLKEKEKKKN